MPYKDKQKAAESQKRRRLANLENRRAYSREYYRKWNAANKERLAKYGKDWAKKNPEYRRTRYHKNKDLMREQAKRKNWRLRGYPEPTRPKPELCECCNRLPNGRGTLHLDHDHTTGKFRGWLCSTCNTAIGKLGDTVEGVSRAVNYLILANYSDTVN